MLGLDRRAQSSVFTDPEGVDGVAGALGDVEPAAVGTDASFSGTSGVRAQRRGTARAEVAGLVVAEDADVAAVGIQYVNRIVSNRHAVRKLAS